MKALTVIILFVAGIFAGLTISAFLFEPVPVEYGTIDTVMIRQIDTIMMYSLPVLRIDTILKDKIVYEIPVMPYVFKDSIPIRINKKREFVPFKLCIDGYVTDYSLHTEDKQFHVDTLWTKKDLLPKILITGCLAAIVILGVMYFIK